MRAIAAPVRYYGAVYVVFREELQALYDTRKRRCRWRSRAIAGEPVRDRKGTFDKALLFIDRCGSERRRANLKAAHSGEACNQEEKLIYTIGDS